MVVDNITGVVSGLKVEEDETKWNDDEVWPLLYLVIFLG